MSKYQYREELRQVYQNNDIGERTFIPAKPKVDLYGEGHIFRVCAYCRVSTDNDEQLSSFELQQAHYKQLVAERPNWDLKRIFADEGISGTSLKNRDAFNEMIEECRRGHYDLIVTKSVSRFARNLVDCISLIRMLKGLKPPVGVFFETDNLYTLSENTEFMLSFLATFAQEESVKKSEAMMWSLQQRFKDAPSEKAMEGMMLGSNIAGMAFGFADVAGVHCMAEAMGGYYDLPHGLCNAVLLPTVSEYLIDAVPEKYAFLAKVLGEDTDGNDVTADAKKCVDALRKLCEDINIPKLREIEKIDPADFPMLAKRAKENVSDTSNPKEITVEAYEKLFERAYYGLLIMPSAVQ